MLEKLWHGWTYLVFGWTIPLCKGPSSRRIHSPTSLKVFLQPPEISINKINRYNLCSEISFNITSTKAGPIFFYTSTSTYTKKKRKKLPATPADPESRIPKRPVGRHAKSPIHCYRLEFQPPSTPASMLRKASNNPWCFMSNVMCFVNGFYCSHKLVDGLIAWDNTLYVFFLQYPPINHKAGIIHSLMCWSYWSSGWTFRHLD